MRYGRDGQKELNVSKGTDYECVVNHAVLLLYSPVRPLFMTANPVMTTSDAGLGIEREQQRPSSSWMP